MMTTAARLSKSRFVTGCQCHKLLWWTVHEPDATELQPDKVLQDLFDQGRLVGEAARQHLRRDRRATEGRRRLPRHAMNWSPGGEPPPREAHAIRWPVLNGAGYSQTAVVEERQTEILAARPVVERVSLRAPRDPDLDRQRR